MTWQVERARWMTCGFWWWCAPALALRCYRIESEYGGLPKSLDELVAEFLPVVPPDGFGGKPFWYFAEKKIAYCVGKNLTASSGEKEMGRRIRETFRSKLTASPRNS